MHPPLSGLVVDQFGFLTGIVLYAMLVAMVWRERSTEGTSILARRGRLPLSTGLLGLIWNVGGLIAFGVRVTDPGSPGPGVLALAFSALGFLPAVVVHSILEGRPSATRSRLTRTLIAIAYGLSATASVLHASAALQGLPVPSPAALWLLTIGFSIMALLLLLFTRQQAVGRRGIWIVAFSVFAVSALHFNRHVGDESWWTELVGHHASLPLALAILHQDYRFAFADLFLKQALALLLLVGTSLGAFSMLAVPALRWRDASGLPDHRAIALVIVLWIGSVIAYAPLRRLASRFVDRAVLQRPDYRRALEDFSERLGPSETEASAIQEALGAIRTALAPSEVRVMGDPLASDRGWLAVNGPEVRGLVDDTTIALVRLRTVDPPHSALALGPLSAGRRLLSDDLQWLEAVARLTSRHIDRLRVSRERLAHSLRAEAMERLAAEAELRALRAQLSPHFLFNALTTIGYLIQQSPVRALDTLMRLTTVLRSVLRRTTREFSTLADEIDLIRAYLDIERARFEERLHVGITVSADAGTCRIPTLLLQPIVENAIQHGISRRAEGGTLTIGARVTAGTLTITIEDSGAGFAPGESGREPGVGLRSVDNRLRAHFGSAGALRIHSGNTAGTVVEITLPAVHADDPADARRTVA